MSKTTSDLLTNIKRRAQLPDDSGTLSDSDILAFASDELQNVIYPRLMSMNEWHFAYSYNQTITSVRSYRIDSRVAGNRIISVEYTSDSTNYRFIQYRHPLTQSKGQQIAWENYSIYGNNIVLSDGCPTSGTIRVRAVLRPSQLVATGGLAISGLTLASDRVTVSSTSTLSAGQNVDIYFSESPYEIFAMTQIDSIINGTDFSVTTDVDTTWNTALSTGIRVAPKEQTDRVPLPDELHDYLAQRAAIRCMEARGMTGDMNNHARKLADLELAFDRLVAPRNKGEFKAIIPEDYFFTGRP